MIKEVQKNDSFPLTIKEEKMKKSQEERSIISYSKNEKIPLPTSEGYIFISPEDIIRFGANKKVSICVLKSNVQKEIRLSLKQIEEIFKKYDFFRIHHANLVNINHVEKYVKEKNSGGVITMSSGEIVHISKRKKKIFLKYLKATLTTGELIKKRKYNIDKVIGCTTN